MDFFSFVLDGPLNVWLMNPFFFLSLLRFPDISYNLLIFQTILNATLFQNWCTVKLSPMPTSNFLVTTVSAVGSKFEADNTSFSWASFFSRVSARADNFFSSNRFLKLDFCWTSWTALRNLLYNSSLSSWIWRPRN